MYLWNIYDLKKILMLNQLSEGYKFYYLLISSMLFAVFTEVYVFFPPQETNIADKIGAILSIVIQLVGLIVAFKMNGGKDGKEFLARYTSISVSLMFRFLIFTIAFLFFHIFIMYLLSLIIPNQYLGNIANSIDVTFIPAFEVVFYWRLCVHIHDVYKRQTP